MTRAASCLRRQWSLSHMTRFLWFNWPVIFVVLMTANERTKIVSCRLHVAKTKESRSLGSCGYSLFPAWTREENFAFFSRTFRSFFSVLVLETSSLFFFLHEPCSFSSRCLWCPSLLRFHAVFYVYVDLVSLVSSSQFVSPFLPVYLCLSFPLMSVDAWVTERRSMSCRSLLSSSLSSFAWRRFLVLRGLLFLLFPPFLFCFSFSLILSVVHKLLLASFFWRWRQGWRQGCLKFLLCFTRYLCVLCCQRNLWDFEERGSRLFSQSLHSLSFLSCLSLSLSLSLSCLSSSVSLDWKETDSTLELLSLFLFCCWCFSSFHFFFEFFPLLLPSIFSTSFFLSL